MGITDFLTIDRTEFGNFWIARYWTMYGPHWIAQAAVSMLNT